MKFKVITVCLFAGIVLSNVESKAQEFNNGSDVLGVGLGFGSALGRSYSYSSQTPGFSVHYEHGNWDVGGPGVISLGGYLGYKGYSYNGASHNYTWSEKWTYFIIGFRSAYHFNMLEAKNWDLYAGLMLSYDIQSYSYTSSDPTYDYLYKGDYNNYFGFSMFLGGRYYLSEKVGLFAELGYGASSFTIGAAFKL